MPIKDDNSESLDRLLKQWTVSAPLPTRFEEGVWRGIARAEGKGKISWRGEFLNWLRISLPRPAFAAAYLLLLLMAGLALGYRQSQVESARMDNILAERYAQSVVPFVLAQK